MSNSIHTQPAGFIILVYDKLQMLNVTAKHRTTSFFHSATSKQFAYV